MIIVIGQMWFFPPSRWYDSVMAALHQNDPGNPDLIDRIKSVISRQGRITFSDFMRMALYEPGLGYYMSSAGRSGRSGDYYTAPELHPIFGRLVGRQLVEMAQWIMAQRKDAVITIVEMGAGRGVLADDVLSEWQRTWPDWPEGFRYVVVELSPPLRDQQKATLVRFAAAGVSIDWVPSLSHVEPHQDVTGIIFSNELVDAFPVHRVVVQGGKLLERYVTLDGERLTEQLDVPSTPLLADYFEWMGVTLPEGFSTEVNLRALTWMREAGQRLMNGFVLTIDYGHTAEERYASPRRDGTLACYAGHQRLEDPYRQVGQQDLTAQIDFSALVRAGREEGLELTGFTDQTSFLLGLGAAELMEDRLQRCEGLQREVELASSTMLLSPEGMGRAFKVLIQHKGLDRPHLRGLEFHPFVHPASFDR